MKKVIFIIFALLLIQKCERITYVYDDTDPEFSSPISTETQSSSAEIKWETDEPCSTIVEYSSWKNRYAPDTLVSNEFKELHKLNLTSLWPDVQYYCQANIYDYYDNGPVTSDTIKFRTRKNDLSRCWKYIGENKIDSAQYMFSEYQQNTNQSFKSRFTQAWVRIKQEEISVARQVLEDIEAYDPESVPVWAGLIVVNKLNNNYQPVINYGKQLLAKNPKWRFVYSGIDLNYKYIRLIMAEAYLKQNELDECQNQIDILWEELFGESTGMRRDIAETWEIKDVEYNSYENALLGAIDILYNTKI